MTRFCELRRKLVELFADAGIQSAAVDADLLISELAGVPRSELFFLADQPVPPALEKEIRELARRAPIGNRSSTCSAMPTSGSSGSM